MSFSNLIRWIWPSIVDTASAQKASRQGVWASALCAGATTLFIVLAQFGTQMFNVDMGAFLDVLLFIAIGWGIYQMSRTAAVAGLFLYIFERFWMWREYGPRSLVLEHLTKRHIGGRLSCRIEDAQAHTR